MLLSPPSGLQSVCCYSDQVDLLTFLSTLTHSSRSQGIVHIAAVDANTHKNFLYRYKITMYPAIAIFAKYKQSPRRYKGESVCGGVGQGVSGCGWRNSV